MPHIYDTIRTNKDKDRHMRTLTSSTIMPVSSAVICIPLIALFHTCVINLNVESRESNEPKTCQRLYDQCQRIIMLCSRLDSKMPQQLQQLHMLIDHWHASLLLLRVQPRSEWSWQSSPSKPWRRTWSVSAAEIEMVELYIVFSSTIFMISLSYLCNVSKDVGMECEIVFRDVQMSLKKNVANQGARIS